MIRKLECFHIYGRLVLIDGYMCIEKFKHISLEGKILLAPRIREARIKKKELINEVIEHGDDYARACLYELLSIPDSSDRYEYLLSLKTPEILNEILYHEQVFGPWIGEN